MDAQGNLLVCLGPAESRSQQCRVLVTAHLDEIALMVSEVLRDGSLRVVPLGGLHPWKWGEQPVVILPENMSLSGIVSFGSIHTTSPISAAHHARTGPLTWDLARIITGLSPAALAEAGVRPGTRVCLAPERRTVTRVGGLVASYFIDDRADIVAWLLALAELKDTSLNKQVVFALTVAEEVGGNGASYIMSGMRPDYCIALEIGPSVPESPFQVDEQPTVWVNDSYAATADDDLNLVEAACARLGQRPHWQALSRGGSDASCGASRGLVARPITIGLPVENSHGCEVMHPDAPMELARLAAELVRALAS